MQKYILIIVSVLVLSFIACDRHIESRDPVRSLPDEISVPHSLNLFVNNLSVSLDWEIANASDISKYRVYASENDTLNYVLIDSATTLSIELNDLTINRLYYFKVSAVNSSGLEGYLSEDLFAQVGVLSMVIDNNKELTNRTSVQLQFTVSNSASNVKLSEDSTFAETDYEPFSGQKSFTLSSGDGLKKVYAQLLFNNGATNNKILHDSITLDTKARIDSVFFLTSDSLFEPSDTIVFGMITGETNGKARVSFTSSGAIELVDDGTGFDAVADDGNYYGWYVVPNNTNVHNATVTGNFTDEAGNNATALTSFDLININTTPEAVELLVLYPIQGDSARLSWIQSDEPDFESYRLYTAAIDDVLTTDELLTYESSSNRREFVIMPKSGTTYYKVYVFDVHGKYIASNFVEIVSP